MASPAKAAVPLGLQEQLATGGMTHLQVIDYTDLTDTAATSKTLSIYTGSAGEVLGDILGRLKVDFDGGATSELTIQAVLNYGSGTDKTVIAATSIHADGTEIDTFPEQIADVDSSTIDTTFGQQEADVLTSLREKVNLLLGRVPKAVNGSWTLDLVFTATGANLSALTQGKVQVFFSVRDFTRWDQV